MDNQSKIELAKKLHDSENYLESVKILLELESLADKEEDFKNLLLSHSYFKLKEFNKSFYCAQILSEKNPKSEFASQLKYLNLVELKKINEALIEITNFLENNKASLYKTTLEELLEDIEKNTIEIYFAQKIIEFAKRDL